jgi:pilus assembly protein Flp/PilA
MHFRFIEQGTRTSLVCVGALPTRRFGDLSIHATGSDRRPFPAIAEHLMKLFATRARKFATQEEGATVVEYGLMIAVITAVVVVSASLLGTQMQDMFKKMANIASGT